MTPTRPMTPTSPSPALRVVTVLGGMLVAALVLWPAPGAARPLPAAARHFGPAAQEAPIAALLVARGGRPEIAESIAHEIVHEATAAGVNFSLVLGVLLVENPDLKPTARSHQGALGLMQVMPFWRGTLGCQDSSLISVAGSICHGVRILAAYLKAHPGDTRTALLRYNGCVRGTNTSNCHAYPRLVFRQAAAAQEAMAAYHRAIAQQVPATRPTETDDTAVASGWGL